MKRFLLGTSIFAALAFSCTVVFAQQTLELAPSRNQQQPIQQGSRASSPAVSNELSVIAEWEKKVVAKVPLPVKNWFNSIDQKRLSLGLKYAALRDKADAIKPASVKVSSDKKVVVESPSSAYYFYSALSFIFLNGYLFYGIILLAVFFILRFILRRLNVIV